jgi:cobalamin biosynthesis Mg chelatase CobN
MSGGIIMKKKSYIIAMTLAVLMGITMFSTDAYADKPEHANGPKGLGQIKKEIEKKEKEAQEKLQEQINSMFGTVDTSAREDGNSTSGQSTTTQTSQIDGGYSATIGTETSSSITSSNSVTSSSTVTPITSSNGIQNSQTQLNTAYSSTEDTNQTTTSNQSVDSYSLQDSKEDIDTNEYDPADMRYGQDNLSEGFSLEGDNTVGAMTTNELELDENKVNKKESAVDAKSLVILIVLCLVLVFAIIITLKKYRQIDENEDFELFEFEDVLS